MMIHLLLDNKIYPKKALALSFTLADQMQARHWLSTQERNALFLAGISLESNLADSWQAQLVVGEVAESLQQMAAYRKTFAAQAIEQGVTIKSLYDKPLYVSSHISGYGAEKPPESSAGLAISRSWYTIDGELITPDEVTVGDLYIVHLEVTAEERSPDALVVDMIAAGLELENQNLDQAIQLDEFRIDGKTFEDIKQYTTIKYEEYRDDRYVAALDVNTYGSSHLFYLVRAVTPGTYKVPPSLVEDMYRPERRGVGRTLDQIRVSQNYD